MKLLVLNNSIKNDVIFNNSFNSDCIIRYDDDYASVESLLNSITDINEISHLTFIYHYPGYCQLAFFEDEPEAQKTYKYFTNNTINLINQLKLKGLQYVDILSCNLHYDEYIQEINQIQTDLNINIRYSLNQTGNNPSGDWILESDNTDIKNLYFNENINEWTGVLNSDIGPAVRSGAYSDIIFYNQATKVFKVLKNFTWNAATVGAVSNFIQLNINEVFDGDGYQITTPDNIPGMFGINTTGANTTNRPIIKNVGAIGGSTASRGSFFVRRFSNYFIVDTCYATGSMNGGFAGSMAGSELGWSCIIRNCFATGYIGDDSGGMGGAYFGGIIQNCYVTGDIGAYAGGMIGPYCGPTLFQNCYSFSNNRTSGGIIGNVSGYLGMPTMQNCYSRGTGVGNTSGQDYYTLPGQSGTTNGNYQLSTGTFGTVPTNLNAAGTFNSVTNDGNGYVADTFGSTGFPLLYNFTQSPWNGASYTQNTTTPTRLNLMSEPIIYLRPLTFSNKVELYWYPPVINNGYNIDSYVLECSNLSYVNVVSSNSRKSIVGNLITGNSYAFIIRASNIFGNGNVSAFNLVIPGFKPNVGINFDYTNDISNFSKMNFSFNTSTYNGNSTINYNVITMVPVDVTGNVLAKSTFIHDHSNNDSSNVMNPLYDYEFNKNYNYQSYIRTQNTVNDSDKSYLPYIINPSLPTTGLKLWLDPYDLSTLTLSNNKITKWNDKSKNRSNATVSESFGPTYDSGNAQINFNGLQYLNLPANTLPSANSSYSIFTYVSANNLLQNDQWILYSGTPTSNLSLGAYFNSNTLVHSWWNNNSHSKSNITNNVSYLLELTYDSGVRRTLLNGSLVGIESVSTKNSTSANNFIGTNSTLNGNLFGSIGDIIIYDRILNDIEKTSVKNYLERRKYNLSLQNIGNVITWLDASDPNNMFDINNEFKVSYNDYVYNWLDRSYNNNNAFQSNISNLPVKRGFIQNNLDVIEFNQSYLTLPNASYPLDAFIVLKLANISDVNGVLGVGPTSNNYSSLSDISGSRWAIDATSNSVVASTTETSSNFLLMEWSIGDNNNFIRRYGSNIANSSVGTWTLPNNSNIYIGNANGFDFSKKLKGYVGEVIMFNKQLDNNSRTSIEGYLAWKWGLQSYLSSSHPFRYLSPYLFNRNLTTFLPSSIGQLVLWLDASDTNSITRNGNVITRWADRSGTLTTTTSNLTYSDNQLNGLPTINLMNGTVSGTFPTPLTGTIQTTFMIVNLTALVGDGQAALIYNQPGNVDPHRVLDFGFNNFRTLTHLSSWNTINISSAFYNTYFMITSYLSSTTFGGVINGNTPTEISLTPTFNATGFSTEPGWNGRVGEILTYSRALSSAERQKVEGYLAWKWGLQSNLPSTHYFKRFAPSTFTPAIYSPWSWFDVADTQTLNLSGTNVISIKNKGLIASDVLPSNSTQVQYNASYTMNGIRLVTVNNGNSLRVSGNFNFSGGAVFVVLKHLVGTGALRYTFVFANDWNPGDTQVMIIENYLEWGINAVGNILDSNTGPGISANENTILSFNAGSTSNTFNALAKNGSTITLRTNGTTNGNTTSSNWRLILPYGDNMPAGACISVAEHLVFNRTLTTTERQDIEGYLAWKWGLQANLPSGHPYKNAAPV